MISAIRSEQRMALFPFAEGIQALLAGDDDVRSDAAAMDIAEILILHREWLLSHVKKE